MPFDLIFWEMSENGDDAQNEIMSPELSNPMEGSEGDGLSVLPENRDTPKEPALPATDRQNDHGREEQFQDDSAGDITVCHPCTATELSPPKQANLGEMALGQMVLDLHETHVFRRPSKITSWASPLAPHVVDVGGNTIAKPVASELEHFHTGAPHLTMSTNTARGLALLGSQPGHVPAHGAASDQSRPPRWEQTMLLTHATSEHSPVAMLSGMGKPLESPAHLALAQNTGAATLGASVQPPALAPDPEPTQPISISGFEDRTKASQSHGTLGLPNKLETSRSIVGAGISATEPKNSEARDNWQAEHKRFEGVSTLRASVEPSLMPKHDMPSEYAVQFDKGDTANTPLRLKTAQEVGLAALGNPRTMMKNNEGALNENASVFAVSGVGASELQSGVALAEKTGSLPRSEVSRAAVQQVIDVISNRPSQSVEITLSPEELGRVRLVLTGTETQISVSIQAERAETADLMRRHLDLLADQYKALGYSNISFSFGEKEERRQNRDSSSETPHVQDAQEPDQPTSVIGNISASGVDIRV
ncbi:flagellar hook-length control protein FliK [Shimia gijangensis]|nr:flagellar hook-length control protein FliK [Shimia gijangensis]